MLLQILRGEIHAALIGPQLDVPLGQILRVLQVRTIHHGQPQSVKEKAAQDARSSSGGNNSHTLGYSQDAASYPAPAPGPRQPCRAPRPAHRAPAHPTNRRQHPSIHPSNPSTPRTHPDAERQSERAGNTHLFQFLRELLQLGIVVRLDHVVVAVQLVEVQRLLDHLAVLLQARTAFLPEQR
jgi:hypothetical protein